MAGILYFKPGHGGMVTEKLIEEWGLGHVLDTTPQCVGTTRGPKIGDTALPAGCLFGDRGMAGGDVQLAPEKQTWIEMPERGGLCCGYWTDRRPTPEELARKNQLPGYRVKLLDGNDWLIPIVRGVSDAEADQTPTSFNALPRISHLGPGRVWVEGGLRQEHQVLWDMAIRWLETIGQAERRDANTLQLTFSELHSAAAMALRSNYRMADDECSLLSLFDSRTAANVLFAMTDRAQMEAWLKKKRAADGPNSSDGAEGSPEATDPRVPT